MCSLPYLTLKYEEKIYLLMFYCFAVILCIVLRNVLTTSTTTSSTTTLSVQEMKERIRKKKFEYKYNPNYGFEAYWVDGEWVLFTTTIRTTKGETTTKQLTVCDDECNYLYRKIKEVCGRLSDFESVSACSGTKCSGKPGVNLKSAFKTFNTYCEFLDNQCENKFYTEKHAVPDPNEPFYIEDYRSLHPNYVPGSRAVERVITVCTSNRKQLS
ncbi:hypothetical protein B5X24_HaOG208494 [Helicoverpa armigera]|uniref:Uncharacterized protein n=1 Tax=Helicoverpa armigera TaxID=29058 RepID=A0A2W1BGN0_HELAM|nr:hypothetical protein B5X24_HaOG208494 [Helicoverpa armigera]